MKTKKSYLCWLLTLLTIWSLFGCTPYQGTPGESTTAADQSHENYTETQLKAREEFQKLTDKLFLEEIQGSTIDLHYLISDPTAFGIADTEITLGEFSLEEMKKGTAEQMELKKELEAIDPKLLSKNQLLTYNLLMDQITVDLTSDGLEYLYRPLSSTIGVQAQLPVLLAEYTFYNQKDVDDYLLLLSDIDRYYGQIMEFEKEKTEAGYGLGDNTLEHIIQSCNAYMVRPETNFLTETFTDKLDALPELSEDQKNEYKAKHLTIIKEEFIPAYQSMVEGLEALKGKGVTEYGLSYFPQGKEYYEYLVASSTGTSYTVPELKEAIQAQMDQDFAEMYQLIGENPSVVDLLESQSFHLTDPNEILEDLKAQTTEDFPPLPSCNYTVKYVPEALESSLSPAFYLVPPIDNYQENSIYINGSEEYSSQDLYTTLAHEGYPGHLYQNVYFAANSSDNIRRLLSCNGYTEGWATYVENYAYSLDNGLDAKVGKLQALNSSATLALYGILDININYEGWTIEQAKQYLNEYYGIQDEDVVREIYYAIANNPANYLEYYTGYLEILTMRDTAQKTFGKSFDLKKFHTFILDMGPCSFRVIEPYFKVWMASYQGL